MEKELVKDFSKAENAPRDAHQMLYATWILENTLSAPAAKPMVMVISDSISAIAKSKFSAEKWKHPVFTAFLWLNKRCEYAQMAKIPTNYLFFLNGQYNEVGEPEKKITEFKPCGQCEWGWKRVALHKVEPCECRVSWERENRK